VLSLTVLASPTGVSVDSREDVDVTNQGGLEVLENTKTYL
jgi:hypothetical protein